MTFESILRDLRNKIYHPVYFLSGDEGFYIDEISDYIEDNVLTESEKSFNQTILYGRDTDTNTVLETARRLPMMANYQVVIVKEAQYLRQIEKLEPYMQNPVPTTILVFAYRNKKLDKRKTFFKTLSKNAVVFEAKKLYENQVPTWIESYLSDKKYRIQPKASHLLTQYLGTDISKIANELSKLMINKEADSEITVEDIEKNIGISKDYNIFELQNALAAKDITKAYRIMNYFVDNPKNNPLVVIMGALTAFFTRLYMFYYNSRLDDKALAAALKVSPWQVREYRTAGRNFDIDGVERILGHLQRYDLQSKGVNNANTKDGELLKELVYKILH